MKDKIKNLEELKVVIAKHKKDGLKIATTNGFFEILHIGHIYFLESAKSLTDILIVLLNSDESTKILKGKGRPLVSEKERAEMLSALECIDYIIIFDEDKPLDIIKELMPDLHIKGGADLENPNTKEERKLVESYGGKHITLPIVEGYSTTKVINNILNSHGPVQKDPKDKIKSLVEIQEVISSLKKDKPLIKIVTTNGAFDIVHSAHIKSLTQAKSFGDVLIVGLNSDSSIKKYKSELRPIIPQKDRAEMLANLEMVDYVVIFDEEEPSALLRAIKPNYHVKSKSGYKGLEKDAVEYNGGKIILLEDVPGISTSQIINKIIDIEKNSSESR